MELAREVIVNEVKSIVERINNTLNEYYDKYYIYPERSVCKDIYSNLSRAYATNGKMQCSYVVKDTPLFNDFDNEDESKILIICVRNAVNMVLKNYNIDVADEVKNMIKVLRERSKNYLSDADFEKIDEISKELFFNRYAKAHNEYDKVKELFDINRERYSSDFRYVYELLGTKLLLEEFERRIEVIPTIEDKYLKSSICEYFKGFITFEP